MAPPPFTFYTASITKAEKALAALSSVLKKGEQAPNAAALPTARIHEDMLPLTMQVFIATAHATKIYSRAVGVETAQPENNLVSFADLHARIAQTLALLASADAATVNARPEEVLSYEVEKGREVDMSVAQIVEDVYLPNLFFHVVTAYDILRKEGVPLSKVDYGGAFTAQYRVQE